MRGFKLSYPDQKGMTLIEVLIVMAIIAIIGAVGYPIFARFNGPYNFRAAARDVLLATMEARSNAVRDNSIRWRVSVTPPATFVLAQETAANSGVYNTIQTYSLAGYGHGIKLLPTGAQTSCGNATKNWNNASLSQATAISFNGRGFGDAGSFYLEDQNDNICYAVSVSGTGLTRLRRYNGKASFAVANWE